MKKLILEGLGDMRAAVYKKRLSLLILNSSKEDYSDNDATEEDVGEIFIDENTTTGYGLSNDSNDSKDKSSVEKKPRKKRRTKKEIEEDNKREAERQQTLRSVEFESEKPDFSSMDDLSDYFGEETETDEIENDVKLKSFGQNIKNIKDNKIKSKSKDSDLIPKQSSMFYEDFYKNEDDEITQKQRLDKNKQYTNNDLNAILSLENTDKDKKLKEKLEKLTKENKKIQAKKSRVKFKAKAAIKIAIQLYTKGLPKYLSDLIKKKSFSFGKMSKSDEIECYQFFDTYSKTEIALALIIAAKDEGQLMFVKNTMLKEGFFNILFADITHIKI